MRQNIRIGGLRALLNLIRELVAYAYLSYLVCGGRLSVSDFIFYFGIITGFSNWIMNAVYQYSNLERCCNDCAAFREFVESEEEGQNRPDIDLTTSLQLNLRTFLLHIRPPKKARFVICHLR